MIMLIATNKDRVTRLNHFTGKNTLVGIDWLNDPFHWEDHGKFVEWEKDGRNMFYVTILDQMLLPVEYRPLKAREAIVVAPYLKRMGFRRARAKELKGHSVVEWFKAYRIPEERLTPVIDGLGELLSDYYMQLDSAEEGDDDDQ